MPWPRPLTGYGGDQLALGCRVVQVLADAGGDSARLEFGWFVSVTLAPISG